MTNNVLNAVVDWCQQMQTEQIFSNVYATLTIINS